MAASRSASVLVLFFGYWVPNLVLAILGAWEVIPLIWCIVAFWANMIAIWILSWLLSGLSFGEWVRKVMFFGIDSLATSISALSYDEAEPRPWWAGVFEIWWGFSIKYVFSWACWFLVMLSLRADLATNDDGEVIGYGGYHIFWQWMGFVYPIGGLLCFIIPAILCTTKEEYEHDVDAALKGRVAEAELADKTKQ